MPDWTLCTAMADDLPAILDLWQRAGSATSDSDSVEVLGAMLMRWPESIVLAVNGADVVGSIMWDYGGWRGHLYRLAVSPESRGLGIARALVDEAHRRLLAAGCTRMNIIVELDQPLATRFWDGSAYIPVPEVRLYVANLESP
jgi:ribosomal protein S18 acetylase RimI-like enzyme